MPGSPQWLDICRHRLRATRVPFLLVLQHHAIPSATRLAAPVSPALPGDIDLLAPSVLIEDTPYRIRLLDIAAVPAGLLRQTVSSAGDQRDAILDAIDVILHGYPIGRPH